MFVISRTRQPATPSPPSSSLTKPLPSAPSETIELAGSTGNIYAITISHTPSCTCPDSKKGNQCKHIAYVMHRVLKAPAELEYQLAFLTSELQEIFSRAPLPSAESGQVKDRGSASDGSGDVEGEKGEGKEEEERDKATGTKRKSTDGCDCPICFMPFEEEEMRSGDVVWCRAACGNNVHRACFEQWAEAQGGREVRCVYW